MPPKMQMLRVTPYRRQPRLTKRDKPLQRRLRILQRDSYICSMCHNPYPEYHLECDHITPLHQGGEDADYNCQTLCIPCHKQKTLTERNHESRRN